ncbi:MAG TPA: hypothetical protein VGG70_06135 [Candidatus Cybelea sp.]|jgi:hypothetical protein
MKRVASLHVAANASTHSYLQEEAVMLLVIGSLLMVALSLAGILYVERRRYRT